MTTPDDNSNITDQQVSDAQNNITKSKSIQASLITKMNPLIKKINNAKDSLFPANPDARWDLVLKDWTADAWAYDESKLNLPVDYTFAVSTTEATNYLNYSGLNGEGWSYRIKILKYKTEYGINLRGYNPNFPKNDGHQKPFNRATGNTTHFELTGLRASGEIFDAIMQLIEYRRQYYNLTQYIKRQQAIVDKGPSIKLTDDNGVLTLNAFLGLTYNVGLTSEAYLSSKVGFLEEFTAVGNSNSPSAVTNASQLWLNGQQNKGMIQPASLIYADPSQTGGTEDFSTDFVTSIQGNNPKNGKVANVKLYGAGNYAFQFHYNPAVMLMEYGTFANVDANYIASGQSEFIPAGYQTQATIAFEILLNRMFDMKYYDKTTGILADKYKTQSLYYPRQPDINEQKDIFKKGTMYDIEYLLRCIGGVTINSYLGRATSMDGKTADMGLIAGRPAELHLGNQLRYLVLVNSLTVQHTLFDERMVPIFTIVKISAQRVVDATMSDTTLVDYVAPEGTE